MGYRYQPLATATAGGQVQRIEARHRVHARVEGFIRCGKATGLGKWPSVVVRDQHRVGGSRPPSRSTCCAGRGCCCSTGRWPKPNRPRFATGCYTPPPAWWSHSRMLTLRDPRNLALGTRFQRRVRPRPARSPDHQALPDRPRKEQPPPGPWNPASPHDTRRRRPIHSPRIKTETAAPRPSRAHPAHREISRPAVAVSQQSRVELSSAHPTTRTGDETL